MTEVARLEMVADSRDIVRARDELGRFTKQAKATEGAVGGLSSTFRGLGKALAGLGVGYAAGRFLGAIIANTIEAEQVQAQLEARLKSTGEAAGFALGELNSMAKALQGVTTFGDEAIGTAQSLLLTFTKIKGDQFERATEAVLDMAVALRTDASSAAMQLGKALNDPLKGLMMLGRAGVQFTEEQKNLIKALVETGDMAAAQTVILDELAVQMGGSARAARDTLGGALSAAKEAFGDLLEGDTGSDGIRGTVGAINELTATMQSPETQAGFQTIVTGLANITNFAAQTITMVAGLAEELRQLTKADADKSFQGLVDREISLTDQIRDLEGANGIFARTIGTIRNGIALDGDVSFFESGEENLARMRAELERIRGLQDDMLRKQREGARATEEKPGATSGRIDPNQVVGAEVQELTDKLNEQTATLGLTRVALLEYQKQQALSGASTDAEVAAITESYDALIAKTKAEEAATAAANGAKGAAQSKAQAEREAAKAEQERASALSSINGLLDTQAAQIGGPLVQAAQAYAATLVNLNEAEAQLRENHGLTAEAEVKLAIARQQAAAAYEKETAAIQSRLTPGQQMLSDLEFELSLRKMSNVEANTAIQLRGLETAEIVKYGDAIRAANQEMENSARATEAMDVVRSTSTNLLTSLTDRTKTAKEKFEEFINSLMEGLTQLISRRLIEQAFGQQGQAGGGTWGDALMGIFGNLFGSGRAIGGPTSGRKMHPVNENGPEIWNDGRNDWLLPTGKSGEVKQASAGAGSVTNISVTVAASETRRTADQVANRVADRQRTAQRRNK